MVQTGIVGPRARRRRGALLSLRNPFQGREPEIMARVHEAFVGLAQMDGVLAFADL
jgi:hypothetical protein